LTELCPAKDGVINVNMDDEIIRGTTVIKEGKITWPPPPPTLSVAPKTQTATPAPTVDHVSVAKHPFKELLPLLIAGLVLFSVGAVAPESFMSHFTVFVLACFVGYQVIWNVTPALHTPLMSVTNAISGIIVIGALVQISAPSTIVSTLAGFAILIASINIVGGFLVTRRMLEMFRK
jgi:H+-translocating NAD(P) transhydrogenase subunit alpha